MKRMYSFRAFQNIALYLTALAAATFTSSMLARVAIATPAASVTSTALTASNSSLTAGSAVTLTATVTSSGAPVTPGLVVFCDATATFCQGSAILGTAQLTATGTASVKLVLGIGSHTIKAIFVGTASAQSSASTTNAINVTGASPTTTSLVSTGSKGNYTLTATLGYHGLAAPNNSELVSFIDTSNANYSLGSASLTGVSAPSYNFITIPTSPVSAGSFPASQVIADFNGDGIADIAVANYVGNTVSIFAGDGKGGFTSVSGSPFSVGNGPTALAVADLNGDGLPDIIVANASSGTVSVLLNASSGFTLLSATTVGNGPQAIAVGDFNQDGNADLAIANLLDSTISILLGDGTGHFTLGPMVIAYTEDNPNGIVSGDFNQDGFADLAIVNATDGTVSVLLGNGSGSFTTMTGSPFAVPSYPIALATGDFNADGKLDLAVVSGSNNNVSILLNTGIGFSIPSGSPYTTGQNPNAVVVGDFNGDGKQDLAISNTNENTCTVLLGDGTGAFSAATQSPLPNFSAPLAMATGDLNGDGTEDLVVSNVGGNSISIRPLQVTQAATATLSSVIVPGGGNHLLSASYAGDSFYGTSSSTTISLAASPIQTTLTLAVSPSATNLSGQSIQLTASISPSSASGYLTSGTITFLDGSTQIGQATITNGQAAFSTSSLSVGSHSLSASYSGDTNFTSSAANTQTVAVTNFSIAATPATITVSIGKSGTYQITATPMSGGFASPISFSVSGLPTGATATFSPATVTPGTSASSTTLTIATSAQAVALHDFSDAPKLAIVLLLLPIAVALRFRRFNRMLIPSALAAVVLFAVTTYLTGCGGGFGSPPKSYTLTVTATSSTLTHTATVTLNTQ